MPKIIKNNTVYAAVPSSANGIAYNGSSSGISSNTVQGAIDEVANDKNIASVFDSTATYNENDYVIYSGALYRAKNAVSADSWSGSTDWESVTVGEELNNKPFVIVCTQTQFDTWDNSSFPLLNCEYLITDSADVSLNLGDLSDVTTTGASTGDVLVKTANGWEKHTPSYNDLTDKPTIDSTLSTSSTNAIQNQAVATALATRGGIVNFGQSTVKTISTTNVDIISTTVNLNAGTYAFFVGLNVSINTGSYQFLMALSIDNTTNKNLCSNANPTGNSTIIGACEFTVSTSGNHTLKIYGHTANASKTVTVAGANTILGMIIRIS